jgi:hypothetical protein
VLLRLHKKPVELQDVPGLWVCPGGAGMRNILEVLEHGPDMKQSLIVAGFIVIVGTVVGGGLWLRLGYAGSDYQRLHSLEVGCK